ncbi:metallophosphoesterase [Paenibacillus sp. N3.4]|uniref:metallophosphoesterase n=1 Tax=Paenibacillus sp. N3.4 TaxID=2603222 RepID=UPI0021C39A82|nr:metallophosphoesterase [Paenibacillus sp. N3.4]
MSRTFFISDHHFGHKPIIDFESRPFADVEEMTTTMISKWNAVVKKEDHVFHLGDFSFLNKEKTRDIVSQLHGYKFLILGNHDRGRSRSWWLDVGLTKLVNTPLFIKTSFSYLMSLCI